MLNPTSFSMSTTFAASKINIAWYTKAHKTEHDERPHYVLTQSLPTITSFIQFNTGLNQPNHTHPSLESKISDRVNNFSHYDMARTRPPNPKLKRRHKEVAP
ncbi:hypothetical protein F2Q70_00016306 [Brassica cretica]|uniref:Uncharacterized protein n=1 Tax=Brassica cretica TaxID=69181 RepID=A0A3N6RU36_BRACR|nr:hypothetical protein F2Q70_00016306 [Brassica cretica]KAF2578261.1 hypothetical protein F2Q68_00003050 [Brassica cretica]